MSHILSISDDWVRININVYQKVDFIKSGKISDTKFWHISINFTDEGDNKFELARETPTNLVFINENVDRAGRKTKLIFVLGKNGNKFSKN